MWEEGLFSLLLAGVNSRRPVRLARALETILPFPILASFCLHAFHGRQFPMMKQDNQCSHCVCCVRSWLCMPWACNLGFRSLVGRADGRSVSRSGRDNNCESTWRGGLPLRISAIVFHEVKACCQVVGIKPAVLAISGMAHHSWASVRSLGVCADSCHVLGSVDKPAGSLSLCPRFGEVHSAWGSLAHSTAAHIEGRAARWKP